MQTKAKQQKQRASNGRPLTQVAALPFRMSAQGQLEILVMTSRETHRAVIPKGWPMKNRKDWKSAQIEAREEAGVVGEISRKTCGYYSYWKRLDNFFALSRVAVYPLAVKRQLDDWPERHERVQYWVSPEDAALLMDETDLGALILDFARNQERPAKRKKTGDKPAPAAPEAAETSPSLIGPDAEDASSAEAGSSDQMEPRPQSSATPPED